MLGVDLGDRRVGLAICDEDELLASPAGFEKVRSLENAIQSVLQAVEKHKVGRVVLGYPRNMNGRPGPKAKEAEAVAERLRNEGLDVVLWDERLTTAEAERHLKSANLSRKERKTRVDAVAAQRILASYLDARHREGGSG